MDFEALYGGNFSALSKNLGDWAKVVSALKTLETQARDDMEAKATKANWAGVNATVSRKFITKTAGEFTDAHTQAKSIHSILRDTHDELVGYRDELKELIQRNAAKNLTVRGTGGGGFTVSMNIHPDRAAKGTKVADHSQQDVDHLRDDVQRILNRATESDASAARVLRALVDQAEFGFSGTSYTDRDTGAEALKKADEVAALIKKKGDDLTGEEFDRVNSTLRNFRDDPLFQERFATILGPRGTLDFWADIADGSDGGTLQRSRLDQLGDFQQNLSMTLAGATRSDSPAMQNWEREMVGLGNEQIKTRGSQVWGFQLMSNLMRVGDYDDKFLNSYGKSLVETEKKMRLPGNYWSGGTGGPPMPKMNFMGDEEFGRDPMTGFMTALSNSPDAATEFFNGKDPQDNAEWVLKERKPFDDSPLKDGPNRALEATGAAMFAAVSGVSDPETQGVNPVPHTAEQDAAFKRSLGILAGTGNDFPPELRKDMAWAMGNHGETVHKSMSAPLQSPLDKGELLEVTKQVSRNQDSYAVLNEQMNNAMTAEIHTNKEHPGESLRSAGATVGFLEEARKLTINAEQDEDLRDVSWKQRWAYHAVGGAANVFGGDMAQRGVDVVTAYWAQEEGDRIGSEATEERQSNSARRTAQLAKLAEVWRQENGEWAKGQEEFASPQGTDRVISDSADHGNAGADRAGRER
ncbi:hypothetical protein ACH4SP_33930 [Streptomyces sp. NPDC021093]|uniref:hypothetical protein n=1 Tax=Streptomyces sp. NPDC021093 TaxID=3365112 RepID=UPI00378790E0